VRTNAVAESREPACPLGDSPSMRAIWSVIEHVADTDATILIRGESGVGKDFVGRAVHVRSARRAGPFIKVNCAAIPSELLESELFGHERGAFTGAYRRKLGLFECARGGTIYLDEIAELSLTLQAKLLHVLQDFCFSRVGGNGSISMSARVVAATNRDLERAMSRREFREDLYHRVNVVEVRVPPLRERREEILPLAAEFLGRFNARYGRQKELAAETLVHLTEYPWPGNVRELENVIRRMVVLADGERAFAALAAGQRSARAEPAAAACSLVESLSQIGRRGARDAERAALAGVLEQVHWNRAEASRILKVSYKTLLNKISQCQLTPPARGLEAP
jgi:two-component system, NtrC family, response regulator AtoC